MTHAPRFVLEPDALEFIRILHQGGAHRFTQDLSADWPVSYWSRVDEPLRLPPVTGKENSFFSVNPACARVIAKDRALPKNAGKADAAIERFTCSKKETVAALNCLYREYDGKDWVELSAEEIEPHYRTVVAADADRCAADPTATPKPKAALFNEAPTAARTAKYRTDPTHYKALAAAHVDGLTPAPSVIVDSGGGYQCYWLLAETVVIRTHVDDHAAHVQRCAEDLQKRWVKMDARADQGVHDLRRILRIPGTYNHKKAYAPNFPRVSFVKKSFELRYTLAQLIAQLPAPPTVASTKAPSAAQLSPRPTLAQRTPSAAHGDSLIACFNADVDINGLLLRYGYTVKGDRLSRPGEPDSGGAMVFTDTNTVYCHSTNDPMYNADRHTASAFDVFITFEHDGNISAGVQAIAKAVFPPLRLWSRTTSFASLIPAERLRTGGIYNYDAPDTKTFDALCDVWEKCGAIGAHIGLNRLAKLSGVPKNTIKRALARLDGVLIDVTPDARGAYVRLRDDCRLHYLAPHYFVLPIEELGVPSSANDNSTGVVNEYSPRKADDPFLAGTSRKIKADLRTVAAVEEISYQEAKELYSFASPGETGLRILDAASRVGADMTAADFADETGKKLSAIRVACRRLVQHGLLEAHREGSRAAKTYSLPSDVWQRLDAVAPHLRTHTLGAQREDDRLVGSIQWADVERKKAPDPEVKHRLDVRIEKLSAQRIPHLARLHEDLPAVEVKRLAYDVGTPYGPHPATQAKLERLHNASRMDVAEAKRAEQWELVKTAQQLRSDGDGQKDAVRKLAIAGYTPNEAWGAVQQVWRTAGVSA